MEHNVWLYEMGLWETLDIINHKHKKSGWVWCFSH